jgi:thiamine biosynthesis protein ThiS
MAVATERVTINGKVEELPAGLTVAELLERRGIHTTLVAVEHNGRILQREEFPRVTIAAGDRLEIVHFVGGG